MDERENIYDQIAREFGIGNQSTASSMGDSFRYVPYTVADTGATWPPIFCTAKDYSYEDSVKQILADICDILADLLYKEKLTGAHREDLASIRAFIDSIKVEREDNDV